MRSYQFIRGYFSSAKDMVVSTAQSIWKSETAQAVWQGFAAPYDSYKSWRGLINSSEDVETSVTRAFQLNFNYALHSLISYFVYYRMIHTTMDKWYADQDSDSWAGSAKQLTALTTDTAVLGLMNVYLVSLWLQNAVQNCALTSSITYTAAKAMPSSEDFKSCDCSRAQIARADGDSLLFYVGNRYIINKISYSIAHAIPGWKGNLLAFGLEAASFGIPLVEYKFSAVGRCTEHRYKDIFSSHKTYCFAYGASFVAATWSTYKILASVSGEENPYIYDAVFSFMFQMYALLAISREKKFPGNDHVTIDFVAWFNYLIETPAAKYLLEKFLGDLYSIEKLVQSPGVGLLLTVRDNEIKESLSTVRGGIQQVRDIQSNRWYTTAKWASHWLPIDVVPDEVKSVCKSFSKTALSRVIRKIERLLEVARNAEAQRNAQQRVQVIEPMVENHFQPVRPAVEAKPALVEEAKIIPSVVEPEHQSIILSAQSSASIPVTDIPSVMPAVPEQKASITVPADMISFQDDYFARQAVKETAEKPRSTMPAAPVVQTYGPGLFANTGRHAVQRLHRGLSSSRDGSLASLTAAIIEKTKVLK